jgi:hypothetical protein
MPQQITGTIIDATGQPWKSREVVIKSLSTPILFGSSVTGTSKIVFVTKADGTIPLISGEGGPIYLVPGRYDVDLGNNEEGGTFFIEVTETSGSADISTLIVGDDLLFQSSMYQAGSGNPNGVVHARMGASYWDYTNKIWYIKDSTTGNTGWQEMATA